MKPIILALVNTYLPGYKSGGPIRSIANLVEHLGDEFDIRIITSDRDAKDTFPYADVDVDAWNQVGPAQVYYCSINSRFLSKLKSLISNTPHDLLYLNSFFHPAFTFRPLVLRWLNLIPQKPLLVAPRGEFSDGAIRLKAAKKSIYMASTRMMHLYRAAHWQASSPFEAEQIARVYRHARKRTYIAANLPPRLTSLPPRAISEDAPASLKVLFLSRISPMKNLDFALRILAKTSVRIDFIIHGPVDDPAYWYTCQSIIEALPGNVRVEFKGPIEHAQVPSTMAKHDLFFLPTRGENFGHVIAEALSVGTPAIIADTTPWRNLAKAGAGWDLSLSSEESFVNAIEQFSRMDAGQRREMSNNAISYAHAKLADPQTVEANRRMFLELTAAVVSDG